MALLYGSNVTCVYVDPFIQIGLSVWLELEKVMGYVLDLWRSVYYSLKI